MNSNSVLSGDLNVSTSENKLNCRLLKMGHQFSEMKAVTHLRMYVEVSAKHSNCAIVENVFE